MLDPLGFTLSENARLSRIEAWSADLGTFAGVAPLVLSSNAANRDDASMWLTEVAHLWRLAAAAGDDTLIEIGRERGGSTLALAPAMGREAKLYSFDPHSKHPRIGSQFDAELLDVLKRYQLSKRVELIQEDSHIADPPAGLYGLVLLDDDPTLEGTRSDFERYCRRVRPGGRALLHDAAPGGPRHLTLKPPLAEIENDAEFERRPDVGTFVDFERRAPMELASLTAAAAR